MRSFKKMLAALSAVTIAFGAMALQVGALDTLPKSTSKDNNNDYATVSIDPSKFTDTGYLLIKYTAETNEPTLRLTIYDGTNDKWGTDWNSSPSDDEKEFYNSSTKKSYQAYSYDKIEALVLSSDIAQLNNITDAGIRNQGAWVQGQSIDAPATVTDIYWFDDKAAEGETKVAKWGTYGTGLNIPENYTAEKGDITVSYRTIDENAEVKLLLDGDYVNVINPKNTTTTDGITTATFDYETIQALAETKGVSLSTSDYVQFYNCGTAVIYVQSEGLKYVAPAASNTFSATYVDDFSGDGWYGKTYTYTYDSDKTATVSVTVGGQTKANDTRITGTVTYGIIVATKTAGKLDNMEAPTITIN